MSESFEDVVKYAMAVMADCDMIIIDQLKEAHERELSEVQAHYELSHCPSCEARLSVQDRQYQIEQMAEYHRGYTDGLNARDTATWQLDQERRDVARRIASDWMLRMNGARLSEFVTRLFRDITGKRVDPFDIDVCNEVADRLIRLLDGESVVQNDPESPVSVKKLRETPKEGDGVTQSDAITAELRRKIREKVNQELYVVVEADDLHAIANRIDAEHAELEHAMTGYAERAAALEESEARRNSIEKDKKTLEHIAKSLTDMLRKTELERDSLAKELADKSSYDGGTKVDDNWFEKHGYLKLPADKEGVTINIGDWVTGKLNAQAQVVAVTPKHVYWWEGDGCHWTEGNKLRRCNGEFLPIAGQAGMPSLIDTSKLMELPKDKDGEPIHVGDALVDTFGRNIEAIGVGDGVFFWFDDACNPPHIKKRVAHAVTHVGLKRAYDAAERMVTDYALGKITEQQLIERIRMAMVPIDEHA